MCHLLLVNTSPSEARRLEPGIPFKLLQEHLGCFLLGRLLVLCYPTSSQVTNRHFHVRMPRTHELYISGVGAEMRTGETMLSLPEDWLKAKVLLCRAVSW